MNTRIPITALALSLSAATMACDICGVFLGVSPNDRMSSIALFHRYRLLQGDIAMPHSFTKHAGEEQQGTSHYREMYATLEVRADIWLSQRFSVLTSIPVVQNARSIGGDSPVRAGGVGDPFVLARYTVLNSRGNEDRSTAVHRVLLGAGLKLPLGSTDRRYNDIELDPDLQPGTGSWDLLASMEYHVRFERWAASLQVIGRQNGENDEGMRFGTGISSSMELARILKRDHTAWRPFVGAYHEWMGLDRHHDEVLDGTGCSTLFAQAGARVWWSRWSVSLTGQYAIARNDGELMVPNVFRGLVGIHFLVDRPDAPTE